jgi:hypothetical protein
VTAAAPAAAEVAPPPAAEPATPAPKATALPVTDRIGLLADLVASGEEAEACRGGPHPRHRQPPARHPDAAGRNSHRNERRT